MSNLLEILRQQVDSNLPDLNTNDSPASLQVEAKHLLAVAKVLYTHPDLYFDSLSCITGIDNGPTLGTMEVAYNLYSIPYHQSLMLKVVVPRSVEAMPVVPSLTGIWRTADWHEREAYDLLGIYFEGHPDLRRILMPADWVGHPLRKDYQDPSTYRGITVK
ncbi:NADH-quinone oxidoreductase subunit C [Shiella aurantiaca]